MDSRASNLSRLYSIPDAAPLLGLQAKGLWGMVSRREIETVKIGRLRRISEKAIHEFISRNTCPALRDCQ